MISSAIGEIANPGSEVREPCLDVERTFYKGLILFPHYSDDNLTCFAISLLLIQFTPIENTYSWIRLQWITIENFIGVIKTGPFNIIGRI